MPTMVRSCRRQLLDLLNEHIRFSGAIERIEALYFNRYFYVCLHWDRRTNLVNDCGRDIRNETGFLSPWKYQRNMNLNSGIIKDVV